MITLGVSLLSILVGTLIPSYVTLFTMKAIRPNPRYATAFTFGVFLWYFSDTIGGSAYLDVNAGFSGGLAHVGVVTLFVLRWCQAPRSTVRDTEVKDPTKRF